MKCMSMKLKENIMKIDISYHSAYNRDNGTLTERINFSKIVMQWGCNDQYKVNFVFWSDVFSVKATSVVHYSNNIKDNR
jgi:hypothetical protein